MFRSRNSHLEVKAEKGTQGIPVLVGGQPADTKNRDSWLVRQLVECDVPSKDGLFILLYERLLLLGWHLPQFDHLDNGGPKVGVSLGIPLRKNLRKINLPLCFVLSVTLQAGFPENRNHFLLEHSGGQGNGQEDGRQVEKRPQPHFSLSWGNFAWVAPSR